MCRVSQVLGLTDAAKTREAFVLEGAGEDTICVLVSGDSQRYFLLALIRIFIQENNTLLLGNECRGSAKNDHTVEFRILSNANSKWVTIGKL